MVLKRQKVSGCMRQCFSLCDKVSACVTSFGLRDKVSGCATKFWLVRHSFRMGDKISEWMTKFQKGDKRFDNGYLEQSYIIFRFAFIYDLSSCHAYMNSITGNWNSFSCDSARYLMKIFTHKSS